MVHSNPNRSRGRRWKEKFKVYKREDDLTSHVQTAQADLCEALSPKNVDSAHDIQKNTKRSHRRSGKRVKDNHCDTKHMTYSSHLPQSDIDSKHSSPLRISQKSNDSENIDYISSPSDNKLMSSAKKENNSVPNIVFDDSNNCCIPSMVNLDAPNCSDIRVPGMRKRKIKCSNYEVLDNHSADIGCLPGSIIHDVKNDSGDLVLKNMGSLDKEMDASPVLQNRDAPNCSDDISVRGNCKQKKKCLNYEVHKIHSADTRCLPGSIIHKDKNDSGDLVLKNMGSLDKKMDELPVLPKKDVSDCSDIKVPRTCKRKIKCLNNEVQEKHSTDTGCLPDSIIHEDKDDSGDLALKNMCSLDEMNSHPFLPKRALRITFKKKLLVLDLNGILCDVVLGSHGSHMPYKRVGMKSVFKRPFLDDFMAFCFERFAIGIWSSRNKRNITGVIDYIMGNTKDKLLFFWDQTKCTSTGFNTVKNKYKPLVLKELIKLWNKEEATLPWEKGDYSPSNTLLVDDSPYKAICNPPNTAIFPFPYEFRDESDNFLGPGGALRVYLESIAMADDVQEHVKKHSFGQRAITPEDEMWSFYKNIIDKHNSMALTIQC